MDNFLLIDTPYNPKPGCISKPRKVVNERYKVETWDNCREIYHTKITNLPLFFYTHEEGKFDSISAFISKIEDNLKVHPKSQFGRTQKKRISWIRASVWWRIPTMRRSLFTLLLKVAPKYRPKADNFESALFSHEYTVATKYAILRFMSGYTNCRTSKRGWVDLFSSLSEKEIDTILQK